MWLGPCHPAEMKQIAFFYGDMCLPFSLGAMAGPERDGERASYRDKLLTFEHYSCLYPFWGCCHARYIFILIQLGTFQWLAKGQMRFHYMPTSSVSNVLTTCQISRWQNSESQRSVARRLRAWVLGGKVRRNSPHWRSVYNLLPLDQLGMRARDVKQDYET